MKCEVLRMCWVNSVRGPSMMMLTCCRISASYVFNSKPNAAADAWEGALKRWGYASNLKDHLAAYRKNHPLCQTEADTNLNEQSVNLTLRPITLVSIFELWRTLVTWDNSKKQRGVLRRMWRPT
ncbi:hypothetical protein P3T76_009266 [Phytophthora citrophthora]|uniref:Uncharacterized protein n=1 Tax=Phytophthora citrophthora TaxID=4793 RepID=A0AAD9GH88_9STRA|nr:hypothetical protein P3T76_009266 [Phytophthora citrophthora]